MARTVTSNRHSARREFLTASLSAGIAAALPATPASADVEKAAFPLAELSLSDLQERLRSGKETARSLVEKYVARIEAIDRAGPALRSVIEVNPEALSLA